MNLPLVIAFTLLGSAPNPNLEKMTIARVNGDPITVKEVLDVFNERHNGHSKFLGGDAELRKFLGIVLEDKLLVQEAYEIGLDRDPLVTAAADDAERTRVIAALIKEEIEEKARPTAGDVRDVWSSLDTIRQLRQIVVPTRQEAEEIRAAIVAGADPDAFARTCSTAPSRLHGGRIMAMWGDFSEEWERAVFPLDAGDVSPVLEGPGGFEVVVVESRVPFTPPALDKVKDEIETKLYRRRREARKRDYANALWARYHAALAPLPPNVKAIAALLEKAPDTVVATWDGGKLTLGETVSAADLARLADVPPPIARVELENQIRLTVNEPLVVLDGKERKVGQRPDIAAAVNAVREYNMEALLFRDHIFKSLATADDDVRAYYESHKGDFAAPASRRVGQILVGSEAEAKAVAEQLSKGAQFEDLARQKSKDMMTATKGGDLGWITAERVPDAYKEVLALEPGDVSKPIHDASGWHLITVFEAKERTPRAFDEVREQVKSKVADNQKKTLRAAWIDKLRAAAKIEIDDAAIKAFVAANQFDEKAAPPQHAPK